MHECVPSQVGAQGCQATTVSAPSSLRPLEKPLNITEVEMLALSFESLPITVPSGQQLALGGIIVQ